MSTQVTTRCRPASNQSTRTGSPGGQHRPRRGHRLSRRPASRAAASYLRAASRLLLSSSQVRSGVGVGCNSPTCASTSLPILGDALADRTAPGPRTVDRPQPSPQAGPGHSRRRQPVPGRAADSGARLAVSPRLETLSGRLGFARSGREGTYRLIFFSISFTTHSHTLLYG
jgi:hypothetical protein